jgi:hypothetical protein
MAQPELTCPECEGSEIVLEAEVGTDPLVRYYRCAGCGHEWGVTLPAGSADDPAESEPDRSGPGDPPRAGV